MTMPRAFLIVIILVSCFAFFVHSNKWRSTQPKILQSSDNTVHSDLYLNKVEQNLKNLPLTKLNYKILSENNSTDTAWKVKGADGKTIALLKCSSGNTYHIGEYVTYALGKYLDFTIFPVTILVSVPQNLADRLFIDPQQCVLKEWIFNWAEYYWNAPQIRKRDEDLDTAKERLSVPNTFLESREVNRKMLADYLTCRKSFNDKTEFIFKSKTTQGNPLLEDDMPTRFIGKTKLVDVARDFSNMMIFDAIVANNDRFPGGNVQFRSSTQSSRKLRNSIELDKSRLFSLDNGAAWKGIIDDGEEINFAMEDLKRYLRRFDKNFLEKLIKLNKELKAKSANTDFLNLRLQRSKTDPRAKLSQRIDAVMGFISQRLKENSCNSTFIPE